MALTIEQINKRLVEIEREISSSNQRNSGLQVEYQQLRGYKAALEDTKPTNESVVESKPQLLNE